MSPSFGNLSNSYVTEGALLEVLDDKFLRASANKIFRADLSGQKDVGFGNQGDFFFDHLDNISIYDMAMQQDGKVIVSGNYDANTVVFRISGNGVLDSTFADGGWFAETGRSSSLRVLPNDDIILLKYADDSLFVKKYGPQGVLDGSFGIDGTVGIGLEGNLGEGSLALQEDGKILVGGYSDSTDKTVVLRLNADGGLDSYFHYDGISEIEMPGLSRLADILVQPDGMIVIGGWGIVLNGSHYHWYGVVAQFEPDGTLNTDFGTEGLAKDGICESLAIQCDGKLIVGGFLRTWRFLSTIEITPPMAGMDIEDLGKGEIIFKNTSSNSDRAAWSFGSTYGEGEEFEPKFPASGDYEICLTATNDCLARVAIADSSDTSCIQLHVDVPSQNIENGTPSIMVSPNPFRNVLQLEMEDIHDQLFSIFIYDAQGKLAYKKEFDASWEEDISDWPAGSYFYQIINPSNKVIQKAALIKQ